MTESSAKVRLVLESRPESVTLVRSMLSAFADVAGIDHVQLNSLRTTISEASNNVVVHAYDETGPLSVAIAKSDHSIDVLVEDQGGGINRVIPSNDRMGLGLAVISSLADRAEFSHGPAGGTQVHLQFSDGPGTALEEHHQAEHLPEPQGLSGDLVVSLAPSPVLAQVLGRLLRAMAAQSFFPIETLAELATITDRLGDAITASEASESICFSISAAPHRLTLLVGPLETGTAALRAARLGPLGSLVESVTIQERDGQEFIALVVDDGKRRDG